MNQPKVAVVYDGTSGALQGLAQDVASGTESEGAVVRVRRVRGGDGSGAAAAEDVGWAGAVIVGSPSRYGNVMPQLKSYLDALEAGAGEGRRDTVWSGFASDGGALHGGWEATLMTLSHSLLRWGGIARVARRQLLGAAAAAGAGRSV